MLLDWRAAALIGSAARPRLLDKTPAEVSHVHRPPAAICTCCAPARLLVPRPLNFSGANEASKKLFPFLQRFALWILLMIFLSLQLHEKSQIAQCEN
jgi:hypothetical protein